MASLSPGEGRSATGLTWGGGRPPDGGVIRPTLFWRWIEGSLYARRRGTVLHRWIEGSSQQQAYRRQNRCLIPAP